MWFWKCSYKRLFETCTMIYTTSGYDKSSVWVFAAFFFFFLGFVCVILKLVIVINNCGYTALAHCKY